MLCERFIVNKNSSFITLRVGATETLVATVTPDNTTTKTVTLASSDEAVATVDIQRLESMNTIIMQTLLSLAAKSKWW